MPESITVITFLVFLFWAFVFGLGFAIGQWLWSLITGLVRRSP